MSGLASKTASILLGVPEFIVQVSGGEVGIRQPVACVPLNSFPAAHAEQHPGSTQAHPPLANQLEEDAFKNVPLQVVRISVQTEPRFQSKPSQQFSVNRAKVSGVEP